MIHWNWHGFPQLCGWSKSCQFHYEHPTIWRRKVSGVASVIWSELICVSTVWVKIITGSLVILENLFPEIYLYCYRLEIRMNYHYRYRLGPRSRPFIFHWLPISVQKVLWINFLKITVTVTVLKCFRIRKVILSNTTVLWSCGSSDCKHWKILDQKPWKWDRDRMAIGHQSCLSSDSWWLKCLLSGPVLRDTARLSQRYPPSLRAMGFLVSQHGQLGAIPPPPFLSVSPVESMRSGGAIPPSPKGYLSDTGAIPYENKANGCDAPLCDTISKGYCSIGAGYLVLGR